MKNLNELRVVQWRTRILLFIVVISFAFCITGFWFVQIARGKQFREEAENNQFVSRRLPAPRGKILDRTGEVILVDNRPAFNLYVIPEQCENLRDALNMISERINLSSEEIEVTLSKAALRQAFQPLLVREDIAFEKMAFFSSRKNEFPFVDIQVEQKRNYPYGKFAAHVLGRVGEVTTGQLEQQVFTGVESGMMVGQSGLENKYQNILSGIDGNLLQVRDSRGRVMRQVSRELPTAGNDLILTLHFELQELAEKLFANESGALVAMSVKTGEIISLVSSPSYDPNLYQEQFSMLRADEESPLLNRTISAMFSPGSVWKPLMAAAGLREGLITPDEIVFCAQSVYLAGRLWNDNAFHGNVDVTQALTKSSNVFFYKLGNRLGIERVLKWSRRFGFGQPTGIDLPNEKSGLLPNPETMPQRHGRPWYPADTINLSIGQGDLLVTPMQLSVYMAAIANNGYLVQPHLVRGRIDENGNKHFFEKPGKTSIGVEEDTLDAVRKGLWGVVNNAGTATRARIPQISVAGKTGTAQVASRRFWREEMPRELRHHVWFVCFAPYENPEIVVTVFVEHGMNSSRVAVPIAAEYLRLYARLRASFLEESAETNAD
jgi:penicillin-binding protein 2